MENQEKHKCAYIPCVCDVVPGQEYCSEACRDVGAKRSKSHANVATQAASNGIDRKFKRIGGN